MGCKLVERFLNIDWPSDAFVLDGRTVKTVTNFGPFLFLFGGIGLECGRRMFVTVLYVGS